MLCQSTFCLFIFRFWHLISMNSEHSFTYIYCSHFLSAWVSFQYVCGVFIHLDLFIFLMWFQFFMLIVYFAIIELWFPKCALQYPWVLCSEVWFHNWGTKVPQLWNKGSTIVEQRFHNASLRNNITFLYILCYLFC